MKMVIDKFLCKNNAKNNVKSKNKMIFFFFMKINYTAIGVYLIFIWKINCNPLLISNYITKIVISNNLLHYFFD